MSPFRINLLYGNFWKRFWKIFKIYLKFAQKFKNSAKNFLEIKLNKIKEIFKFLKHTVTFLIYLKVLHFHKTIWKFLKIFKILLVFS